ncbi:hypothetical protein [Sphingobacterium sp. HMA12]|uniref:hypothetical protein n=1 Tax=Sphingobacterium sp. HMA12 TaxID=2050894 RepID=UPI000CEA4BF2|nr:hypothetical protein [Sphingobacterium sp. HMA12]
MKKRILLLVPNDYKLYSLIERNLLDIGFEVTVVLHDSIKFRYKNIFQRLYKTFRKIYDRNNGYKKKLVTDYNAIQLTKIIEEFEEFDYCLVLRADFFHEKVLLAAKNKAKYMVSYHYDGLRRSPEIFKLIPIFDKFYVFDEDDIISNNELQTHLLHNFYFDFAQETNSINYDAYFLGFYHQSREHFLLNLFDILTKIYKKVKFQIVFISDQLENVGLYMERGVECLTEVIPFEDYLKFIEQTKIIVDFLIGDHNGLSFRIFEGLKYEKKVITTNINVVKYDFYHPNNFYVLDYSSMNEADIITFLRAPYVTVELEIRKKYSFSSWISQILDVD